MVPIPGDTIEGYIERQCKLWFGKSGLDPLGVGRELRKHGFLRTVLLNLEGKITDWATLTDRIARWDTQFEGFTAEDRHRTLQSFLALVSQAKRRVGDRDEPFLACQVQLWVREMSRMVRAVAAKPAFFWRDETPLSGPLKGLPAVYCRECGHTGWLGFMRQQDHAVTDNLRVIYPEYFDRGKNIRYFFPGSEPGRWSSNISIPRRWPWVPKRTIPAASPRACRCGCGTTSPAARYRQGHAAMPRLRDGLSP